MEFISDTVVLSRMQFALTASIHMLWPTLTTGVGIYLVIIEGLWLKTRNRDYYYHARFGCCMPSTSVLVWQRHSNGISVWHQLGTFSEAVTTFLAVSFEASWAFMLEAASGHHVVWLGARQPNHSLSLYNSSCDWGKLIHALDLTANSWMQTPRVEKRKFVVHYQRSLQPFHQSPATIRDRYKRF